MTRKNAADIIGIGAQKSATSWAAHVLNLQPSVWIPRKEAHAGKEVSFFDLKWDKGRDWYRKIMNPPREGMKSMDVSPGYATVGPGRVTACREISPQARVFFIMRNPRDRDWSSICMQATRRKFPLGESSFIDAMVFYSAENVQKYSKYVMTVKQWRAVYGKQLLIALYDDICTDAHSFYSTLCSHVNLNPDEVPDWRSRIEKRVFPGPEIPMPPEMHEFLSKKYKPMVAHLQDLIDRDLTGWMGNH